MQPKASIIPRDSGSPAPHSGARRVARTLLLVLLAPTAHAGDALADASLAVGIGVLAHDRGPASDTHENGVDLNGEIQFAPLDGASAAPSVRPGRTWALPSTSTGTPVPFTAGSPTSLSPIRNGSCPARSASPSMTGRCTRTPSAAHSKAIAASVPAFSPTSGWKPDSIFPATRPSPCSMTICRITACLPTRTRASTTPASASFNPIEALRHEGRP